MLDSLYVMAVKHRKEIEEKKEQKARDLATLLDEHPESRIVYDWYSGIDPEVDRERIQYIFVSRLEITEVELDTGETINLTPKEWYGYHRYDAYVLETRIREIRTAEKNFKLRRP